MYANSVCSSHSVLGFSSFFSSFFSSAGAGAGVGCWAPADDTVAARNTATATRILIALMASPLPSSLPLARSRSHRGVAMLTGPNPDCVVETRHEDLAVPDRARLGGARDERHHFVHQPVRNDDLDLHLRQEVHGVFPAAVHLGVSLLPTEAADLAHRHADHAGTGERFLDLVQLERLDDRLDLRHDASRSASALGRYHSGHHRLRLA